jgi:hypothetical protein
MVRPQRMQGLLGRNCLLPLNFFFIVPGGLAVVQTQPVA